MSKNHQIEQLLPWYVTGRLKPADKKRVEKHLSEHPETREQLKLISEEMGGVVAADEAVDLPASVRFDSLMQGIRESGSSEHAKKTAGVSKKFKDLPFVGDLISWLTSNEVMALRYGLLAASVALIVMAAALGNPFERQQGGNDYRSASLPTVAANINGARLHVSFTDRATIKDISMLLEEIDAEIAAGPTAGGLYTIRLFNKNMTDEQKDNLIGELQKRSKLIKFVGSAR